jgi:hypothetical protein
MKQVRNPVWIMCTLKKNIARCMYIPLTPKYSGLRCSPTVDSQSLNILMLLSVLCFALTFFISVVSVSCMMLAYVSQWRYQQGTITGYLPQALIWIWHFFVYHTCKEVHIMYKYVINAIIYVLQIIIFNGICLFLS